MVCLGYNRCDLSGKDSFGSGQIVRLGLCDTVSV